VRKRREEDADSGRRNDSAFLHRASNSKDELIQGGGKKKISQTNNGMMRNLPQNGERNKGALLSGS